MLRGFFTAGVGVCAAILLPALEGSSSSDAPATARSSAARPAARMNLNLDALVLEWRAAPQRMIDIDMDALNAAASDPAALVKAMTTVGTVSPVYRVCSGIVLNEGVKFTLGANAPFERGRSSGGKQTSNLVEYKDVGATLSILVRPSPQEEDERLFVHAELELSAVSRSRVAFEKDTQAPLFNRTSQDFAAQVLPGHPVLLVSVNAGALDENGQTLGYVTRLIVNRSAE